MYPVYIVKEKSSSKTNSKLTSEIDKSLTIYFDFDKSKPNKKELDKLAVFALRFKEADTHNLLIINGYTDDSGKKLSEKRARYVYKYLKKYGIEKKVLSIEGRGVYTDRGDLEIKSSKKRKVEIIEEKN